MVSKETKLPSTFYEYLYSQRLQWTGHNIPIRFKLNSYYVEGYIKTVKSLSDCKKGHLLKVYPAFKHGDFLASYEVTKDNIFPTSRLIYCLHSDNEKPSFELSSYVLDSDTYDVPELGAHNQLAFIVNHFTNKTLTEQEILSSTQSQELYPNTKEYITELLFTDTRLIGRNCLITGSKEITYTVNIQPQTNSLEELYNLYSNCSKCTLSQKALYPVTSKSLYNSLTNYHTLIIGEAPGKIEEENNRPFDPSAPAGGVLHKVLEVSKLDPSRIYFTNAVLCRPTSSSKSKQNEKPKLQHIAACGDRLKREVELVNPKVIILLGETAYKAFMKCELQGGLLKNIGHVVDTPEDRKVYLFPHPSYIARQISFTEGSDAINKIKQAYLDLFNSIEY